MRHSLRRSTFSACIAPMWMHLLPALVLATRATIVETTSRSPPRGSIVMFVADDLGWNDLQFRNPLMRTPVIDSLRQKGVSLSNYYVQPVCSPTRGSLLSSRFPLNLGYDSVIHDTEPMGVPLDAVLLPQALAAAGFATHLLGKWHIGMFKPAMLPINRGFSTAFGYLCGSTGYWSHGNTESFCPGHTEPFFVLDLTNGTHPALGEYGGRWNGTYETEMYSVALEEILDNRANLTQPLFLYVAPNNVHTPLGAPELYYQGFEGELNKGRKTFSATAAAMDAFVANVTGSLERRGLMEEATFVFTTDNGGNLRGSGNNWPLREGGVRGLSFITSPSIPPSMRGTEVHGLAHAVDWGPTILEIAGVAAGPRSMGAIDGLSLLPMLSGGTACRKEIPHSVPKANGTGVLRQGEFKLIAGFPGDGSKNGCVGGCWCPLPDPKTGVQTCIPPTNNTIMPSSAAAPGDVAERNDPPSAQCAAAMNATGCGATTHTSKACSICSRTFNASLSKAGCREKDPKHWCNNIQPPGPTPPPAPSPPAPSPPLKSMPCAVSPCLFNVVLDPRETADIASERPDIVSQMMARLEDLRAVRLVSPFKGGHHDVAACAAIEKNGAVSPWESDNATGR